MGARLRDRSTLPEVDADIAAQKALAADHLRTIREAPHAGLSPVPDLGGEAEPYRRAKNIVELITRPAARFAELRG